jgi:hypothetical protein
MELNTNQETVFQDVSWYDPITSCSSLSAVDAARDGVVTSARLVKVSTRR